jgi:hypothetical protein
MTNTRASDQAAELAEERIEPLYGEEAGDRAEAALLDDELWCWLADAAERAADMEVYRALDINEDDQRHDEIRGHLERAHGHLSQARDLRSDDLLDAALDDYDPEDLAGDSA